MDIKILKDIKKPNNTVLISVGVLFGLTLLGIGVVTAITSIADWGAEHQFIKQRVMDLAIRMPYRIEKIKPKIEERVAFLPAYDELTTTEQKILQKWTNYKDAVLAMAIFDCGESRMDQYAVSGTGDLGIAQINWPIWKKPVLDKFGYNAMDMFNVDRNLDVAYWIWDRADGKEENGEGSWSAWSGFNNGAYTNCFK